MPHDHLKAGSAAPPELLAPAGSPEALAAAVAAGADAVYLAGRRFGARHYAANFSDDELRSAVDYAHLRGVRVYVTVNTLVSDAELPDVVRYLLWLYETG
ncbi:peptidase U32 family protein, partial [Methanoculleus sp. UBA413]